LDTTRARLRMSVRPRDRSADNILLATNSNITPQISSNRSVIGPTFNSPIQRSLSFKRPQEINETKLITRPILKSKRGENYENDSTSIDLTSQNENFDDQRTSPLRSRYSSQEHIYDNLDVFKRATPNMNLPSNEDVSSSSTIVVKSRDHSIPTTRLRPLTMHASANNDKQTANEFENVFHQLKKRGSIRRVRPDEETIAEPAPVEESSVPPAISSQPEYEPIVLTNKTIETMPTPQTPNRRKTVGGVCLPANNKVATNDNKPAPSWVDIAKQKQTKL
jgi:hypothetical protein